MKIRIGVSLACCVILDAFGALLKLNGQTQAGDIILLLSIIPGIVLAVSLLVLFFKNTEFKR